jgi:hypothetical protein
MTEKKMGQELLDVLGNVERMMKFTVSLPAKFEE